MTYTNKVELKGFLGAAAAPKTLDGGKTVLNFSVATKIIRGKGDQRQERTEWHRVTVGQNCQSDSRIDQRRLRHRHSAQPRVRQRRRQGADL